ncbi:NUDIX domain-containing protein [Pseudomonas helleri]|uniref:NUDIX domain-containing protein n=1 Tax=Pseudomonas helleri TaxID=1608996 RepID=A0A7X1XB10_9PSED|nr:NUDIX domain-containing protein [Pseudomonas helleri]MQT88048.1 NUDIX domain-containing protein [Pseudomonas helleri]
MSQAKEMHSTVIYLQNAKILFVRKDAPEWSLPGGKIEQMEQPLEAARRELREETTLTLEGEQLLGHFAFKSEEHLYRMPVIASIRPIPSDEIVECRWFTLEELQQVAVKPTNVKLLNRIGQLFHE